MEARRPCSSRTAPSDARQGEVHGRTLLMEKHQTGRQSPIPIMTTERRLPDGIPGRPMKPLWYDSPISAAHEDGASRLLAEVGALAFARLANRLLLAGYVDQGRFLGLCACSHRRWCVRHIPLPRRDDRGELWKNNLAPRLGRFLYRPAPRHRQPPALQIHAHCRTVAFDTTSPSPRKL